MFRNPVLSLRGLGLLYDIYREEGHARIRLKMINSFDSKKRLSEDILIDCQVSDDEEFSSLFAKPKYYLVMEKTVILQFEAEYAGFKHCHSGMAKNDPDLIIQLRGNLIEIHKLFIDGVNLSRQYQLDYGGCMVTHGQRV